jgi:hypothetical protein
MFVQDMPPNKSAETNLISNYTTTRCCLALQMTTMSSTMAATDAFRLLNSAFLILNSRGQGREISIW